MTRLVTYIILAIATYVLTGCSATKGLQPEAMLFEGTDINITDKDNINNKRELDAAFYLSVPKENTPGLLNIRTGLYNIYDSGEGSGFKNMVKNKLGSRPVVFENQMIVNTQARLLKTMIDHGYFDASVVCDTSAQKRSVEMTCEIDAGPRFKIGQVIFPYDSLVVTTTVDTFYDLQYLESGDYYKQINVVNERAAIAEQARNIGYTFFQDRDVIIYIDTLENQNLEEPIADLYIEFQETEISNHNRFRTGKIYVRMDHKIEEAPVEVDTTFVEKDNIYMLGESRLLRPSALDQLILLNQGEWMSERKQKLSVNRLLDLGMFKFVNNQMKRRGDTLDQTFLLTKGNIKSISGELELNNRSGNIFGTAGNVGFVHRNLFGGGERFSIGFSGGVETQFGDENLLNSAELSANTSLEFPRLVIPFLDFSTNRYFVPKTLISGSIQHQRRVGYYSIQNQKFRYGFQWREDRRKTHELFPFDLVNFYVLNKTLQFDSILNAPTNRRLFESFQDVLIFGLTYSFTYNNTIDVGSRNNFYYKVTWESAGNLWNLVTGADQLFNTTTSQYAKITNDVRKYWKYKDSDIATRLIVGTGLAYGSSTELPYSRQFSIGGANSLRAYPLRGLGPGTFRPDTTSTNQFIDQTGNMKIELNAEYRFPIFGWFKGAFFADAGNIWLIDSDASEEEVFHFEDFYKEIAIGTGVGLRMDFEFFVLRFDLAFPVRGPRDNGAFEWKFNKFDPLSKSWRRNNLRLNLGIGYPF